MIPSMARVTEKNNSTLICSSLATFPPSAALATDVVVSLSTVDGTGESLLYSVHISRY